MFTFLSVLLKLYIVLKIHLFPFMQNYGIFTEVLQYKKKNVYRQHTKVLVFRCGTGKQTQMD